MKPLHWLGLIALGAVVLVAGCHQHPATSPGDKEYDVKGKVVSVNQEKKTIKLDHEDIPGLMKAMTMDFAVENPALLERVAPGDAAQGRLKVTDGKYVLTRLEKR